jgi:pyruvate/2-oxoglutarate dehydrogenase complex dihydrolipoamide acyltransferase (E2) component
VIGEAGAVAAAPAKEAADDSINPPGAGETPLPRGEEYAPVASEASHADLTLSPAVRRAVLEHHVDPSKIKGTGKDGRSPRTTCSPRRGARTMARRRPHQQLRRHNMRSRSAPPRPMPR